MSPAPSARRARRKDGITYETQAGTLLELRNEPARKAPEVLVHRAGEAIVQGLRKAIRTLSHSEETTAMRVPGFSLPADHSSL